MTSLRLPLLAAALLLAGAPAAEAQGFFERLFGITPSRPTPPPQPQPIPGPRSPDPLDPGEEPRRTVAPPQPARPVAIRAPSDDAVIGRELKQNGSNGSLRLERTGRGDLRARLTVVGRRSAQSVETCGIVLGGPDGAPLVAQGRPDGVSRYQLNDPTCPLQLDILDEAVLVKGPASACVFEALSCQADAGGMWGPEPAQLMGKARDYEQARGSADKAVRDNYKVMVQRAAPPGVRPIVAEQAAFSSDREMLCRSYAREGSHSFCNSRFTEARAISLAVKLGVSTTASTPAAEPRSRRARPDPYGIQPSEELVQGRGLLETD